MSRARRLQSSSDLPTGVEQRIANLYTPDLSSCWGVECVQVASLAQPFRGLIFQALASKGTLPSCGRVASLVFTKLIMATDRLSLHIASALSFATLS